MSDPAANSREPSAESPSPEQTPAELPQAGAEPGPPHTEDAAPQQPPQGPAEPHAETTDTTRPADVAADTAQATGPAETDAGAAEATGAVEVADEASEGTDESSEATDQASEATDAADVGESGVPETAQPVQPDAAEVAGVVEAVLFATHSPISAAKIAQIAELPDRRVVREAIETLNQRYEQIAAAYRIERIAGGFQMLTLPEYNDVLARLLRAKRDSRLSAAAIETLAIVAYRQPILRADVEAIRGVACGEVLRSLMEKQMVKIVGRAEVIGRPMLYGTTRQFLEAFGLDSLDELPRAEQLRLAAHPEESPDKPADQPTQPDQQATAEQPGDAQPAGELAPGAQTAAAQASGTNAGDEAGEGKASEGKSPETPDAEAPDAESHDAESHDAEAAAAEAEAREEADGVYVSETEEERRIADQEDRT